MPVMQMVQQAVFKLSRILCRLPENHARAMAASTGIAVWIAWANERRRIEDCVDRVYFRLQRPMPMPASEISRRAFIHFATVACELLLFPALTPEKLAAKVNLQQCGNIDKALEKGRGVIMALPHIGNWEILGAALVNAGYPLHSFFLAQKENEIGGVLDYFRRYSGITLYDRDRGGIKGLKALRSGEILGMIADQDGANNGVYMDFLGHWVSMPAGPANWSLKTGAALVPLFSIRQGHGQKYNGMILPALPDENPDLPHNEQVIARTLRLARWMEEIILAFPHQYLWFYDRFKPRHESWITGEKLKNGQMQHGFPRYGS